MKRYAPFATLVLACALAGCTNADFNNGGDASADSSESRTNRVNGSVSVKAGQKAEDVSTVNGSIRIDADAVVSKAETVNGGISLGARASAESLETVNGGITLEEGVKVADDVSTVNGSITLEKGANVGGSVENVNGRIRLTAAEVQGGISTNNGDIEVGADSRVHGGITVERSSTGPFSFGTRRIPRVVIGPGAVVDGKLVFEREVKLYVSDRAQIGPVEGATPVKFSGDRPPAD